MRATLRDPGLERVSPDGPQGCVALRFDDSIYPAAKVRPAGDRSSPLMPETAVSSPVRRNRRLWVMGLVAAAAAIVVGVGYAISQPVLSEIVRDRVEAALLEWSGPHTAVQIEELNAGLGVGFELIADVRDLTLRNERLSVAVPHARIRVNPVTLSVHAVEITEPSIMAAIPRQPESFAIGGADDLQAGLEQGHAALMSATKAAVDAGLERVTVSGAAFQLDVDRGEAIELRLDLLAEASSQGRVAVRVALNGPEGVRADLDYALDVTGKTGSATVGWTGFRPDGVAWFADAYLGPLSGDLTAAFDEAGGLEAVTLDLDMGSGGGTVAKAAPLRNAELRARWSVPERVIQLSPSSYVGDDIEGVISGDIDLNEGAYVLSLSAETRFAGSLTDPFTAEAKLAAAFDPDALTIAVDSFDLASEEGGA